MLNFPSLKSLMSWEWVEGELEVSDATREESREERKKRDAWSVDERTQTHLDLFLLSQPSSPGRILRLSDEGLGFEKGSFLVEAGLEDPKHDERVKETRRDQFERGLLGVETSERKENTTHHQVIQTLSIRAEHHHPRTTRIQISLPIPVLPRREMIQQQPLRPIHLRMSDESSHGLHILDGSKDLVDLLVLGGGGVLLGESVGEGGGELVDGVFEL